jgi:hypothetical protein
MMLSALNAAGMELGEQGKYIGFYKGTRGFLKPCYLKIEIDNESNPDEIMIGTYKRKSRFVSGLKMSPYVFKNNFENLSISNPIVVRDPLQTNFTRGVCQFFGWNCEEGWREHQIIADAKKSISEFKYIKNDVVLLHCKKLKKIR